MLFSGTSGNYVRAAWNRAKPHKCRSMHILGVRRSFAWILQLSRKDFVRLLPTNFLPQRSWRPYFDATPEKGRTYVFLQTLGAILLRFLLIFPRFLTNQNLWVPLRMRAAGWPLLL